MTENKKPLLKIVAERLQALSQRGGSQLRGITSSILNKFKKTNGTTFRSGTSLNFKKNLKNFQELSKTAIQNFDPQVAIDWATQTFQKRGAAVYGTLATITLSTYFAADLTALIIGDFIPAPPVPRASRMLGAPSRARSINDYTTIFSRNLFNSQGIIAGEDPNKPSIPGDASTSGDLGGAPIKSTLTLNLIGTLILEDELRSIATIEDKTASATYPVRVEDEIPDKLKVLKIESNRVTFVNKSSGRREYLELVEENPKNPRLTVGGRSLGAGAPGIEKLAPTQYNVSRSEVDKALADFNNILTQARAVPNIENGVAAGYKLFQIVPGSIYDKLGLQNGDVISGLNGTPINDPAKAFEMLSELKTSSHMELQVKKDGGKATTYTYDIR